MQEMVCRQYNRVRFLIISYIFLIVISDYVTSFRLSNKEYINMSVKGVK